VTEGGQNIWMKTRFNLSQVFSKSDRVLPNHLLAALVRVRGKIRSIMSFPKIPGINIMDRNGRDIFSAPKLPFGVSERSEHLYVATPSHDRERGSN
ncbi:hypothetical protein Tco_1157358, partial [Tanacetum coccineum]